LDDKVNIRFYQKGDDEQVVMLLKKIFPKWSAFKDPLSFWRWKYVDNPQKTVITVALVDDKIVGCNHSIIFNAKLGSEISTMSWGDDLAVDEEYRGMHLWAQMREYKDKSREFGEKYTFSTTVNPKVIQSWKERNRAIFPLKVTRMVRIHDVGLHLKMRPMENRKLLVLGYTGLKTLNRFTNLLSSDDEKGSEYQVEEVKEFDKNIDSFWDKIKDDYLFILEKKHPHLNWRFSSSGKGGYHVFQAVKGGEILGYMVLKVKEEDGYGEGQIEDLLALKTRSDVAQHLLGYACKFFDECGVNAVYYQMIKGHPYQVFSKREGFVDSRSSPYINFNYTEKYTKMTGISEIDFLKNIKPNQAYFGYAETV
jgi:hypothetical protein